MTTIIAPVAASKVRAAGDVYVVQGYFLALRRDLKMCIVQPILLLTRPRQASE